jgi:hypothetical protein
MTGHLSDGQWAAAVLKESEESAAKHLADCATCRDEVRAFAAALGAAQAQSRQASDQPEAFWHRQHKLIGARLAAGDFIHPWHSWIWVTATVILVVVASVLLSRNNVRPAQSAAQAESDDALMLTVRQSIQSDVPQALRPAALLTLEINRAQAAHTIPWVTPK